MNTAKTPRSRPAGHCGGGGPRAPMPGGLGKTRQGSKETQRRVRRGGGASTSEKINTKQQENPHVPVAACAGRVASNAGRRGWTGGAAAHRGSGRAPTQSDRPAPPPRHSPSRPLPCAHTGTPCTPRAKGRVHPGAQRQTRHLHSTPVRGTDTLCTGTACQAGSNAEERGGGGGGENQTAAPTAGRAVRRSLSLQVTGTCP